MLRDLNLPPCLTKEDLVCNFGSLTSYLGSTAAYKEDNSNCPRPCQTTSYRVSTTENRNFEFDHIISYAEVTSTDVAIAEEYLVFDENDILTALGGSLGLFLGFSCWGIAKQIIEYFKSK